jgi:GT2 family glycosyltransferase
MNVLKFSLVLATVDRSSELIRLFKSLTEQSYSGFEVIVIDQNEDDRLEPLLTQYASYFPLRHLRSSVRGLSRARNLGLEYVRGEIVGFPDDDCWYPSVTLELVGAFFARHPEWAALCGRSVDQEGKKSHADWPVRPMEIGKFNLWTVSFALFFRRSAVQAVGGFDEELGVGAGTPWGSCEESDFALRAIQAGHRIFYDPALFVYHPQTVLNYNARAFARAYHYAMGQGRLLRKHRYPVTTVFYRSLHTLAGSALALSSGRFDKALYHWKVFEGRLRGWVS